MVTSRAFPGYPELKAERLMMLQPVLEVAQPQLVAYLFLQGHRAIEGEEVVPGRALLPKILHC